MEEKMKMNAYFYQFVSLSYKYLAKEYNNSEIRFSVGHLENAKKLDTEMNNLGMLNDKNIRTGVLREFELEVNKAGVLKKLKLEITK